MCTEAKEYLRQLSEGRDVGYVRSAMEELLDSNPYIFSDLKGLSIARVVTESLRVGLSPKTPPLMTVNEDSLPAWHVTRGFVDGFGATSLDELREAKVMQQLGAQVVMESVSTRLQFTPYEMSFRPEHIAAPAVRLHISLPEQVITSDFAA